MQNSLLRYRHNCKKKRATYIQIYSQEIEIITVQFRDFCVTFFASTRPSQRQNHAVIICQKTNPKENEKSHQYVRKGTSTLHCPAILEFSTISSRARICSESIAHEADGRMGYLLRRHFSKIQLIGQSSIETKHFSLVTPRL